uniref:Signal recognition particle receptor subunit alpha homolog n=1 Tax=Arundo donax TaxID=35708 RepID=A0A0A9CN57_ARUDO
MLRIPYVAELLSAVRREFARIYHPKRAAYDGFADTFRQLHLGAQARAEEMKNPKQETTAFGNQQPHHPPGVDSQGGGSGNDDDGDKGASGKDNESDDDGDSEKISSLANGSLKGEEDSPLAPGVVVNAFDLDKLRKLQDKKNNMKVIKPVPKQNFKPPRIWNGAPQSDKKLDYTDSVDEKGDQVTENVAVKQGKSMMDKNDDVDDGKPHNKGWFSTMFQSSAINNVPNKSDLQPALKALKDRLMTKNVAEEIAEKLCESVAASLKGKKLGSFTTLSSSVQTAMEEALLHILTPRRSIDILREVHAAKDHGRPYVIVFVGVNGVGKSTNLAKVAYWLLQHELSVTLAACDTFRSGAVEQLRTHARRLQIPIFDKGYEKDPAVVAREVIQEACRKKSDVVLVDTAGRMQDNEPLMRALSKLINLNNPDLVLFVGEALVGNDAVDQLTKFNQKLADLSTAPTARLIDGILLTKFDTIDDKGWSSTFHGVHIWSSSHVHRLRSVLH